MVTLRSNLENNQSIRSFGWHYACGSYNGPYIQSYIDEDSAFRTWPLSFRRWA